MTTHAELVEKVARAMAVEADHDDPDFEARAYRRFARAALATIAEALRVPSDAMTINGAKTIAALPSMTAGDDFWNANACWRAMLAASPLMQEDKQ